jgi:predicted kinase
MPTAHLVCGPTGAGKTTYAIALAAQTRAVRLSTDEWVAALFIPDRPGPPSHEWLLERAERCEGLIWAVASRLLGLGTSVVLDVGLWLADHRDRWRGEVAGTVAESKLHYLDVSRDIRLGRVLDRNRLRPPTYAFEVNEAMFNLMEIRFEPPTDDELYGAMIVCEE